MNNQRQLEDIAIWDWQWASAAFQMLTDNPAPGVGLGYGLAHTEINDLGFAGFATEP